MKTNVINRTESSLCLVFYSESYWKIGYQEKIEHPNQMNLDLVCEMDNAVLVCDDLKHYGFGGLKPSEVMLDLFLPEIYDDDPEHQPFLSFGNQLKESGF